MRFIWDENKNRTNKAKHGVSFEVALRIFDDPFHLSIQDRHEGGEDEEVIRIISARKATRQERARYEQGH